MPIDPKVRAALEQRDVDSVRALNSRPVSGMGASRARLSET